MTCRMILFTGLALLLGWCVAVPELPGAGETSPVADDVQDMVFLGDNRPLLIRLHLRIDGQPYRAVHRDAWSDYVKALFRQLDRNGDGFLSEAEAQLLPPPPQLSNGSSGGRPTNLAFNFRVVDADGNGKLDLAELMTYYKDYGAGFAVSRAFSPRVLQANPDVDVTNGAPSVLSGEALFNRLDTNRDGKLSEAELAAAEAVLMPLDADGDEMLTPAELMSRPEMALAGTVRAFMARPGNPAPDRFPFVFPGQGAGGAALAQRLLQQYGAGGVHKEKKLSREDLGLDADSFQRLDTNRDGVLDAGELAKFADGPADVELLVRLGDTHPGEALLDIVTQTARPAPSCSVQRDGAGTVLLTGGPMRLELRANEGRPTLVTQLRQEYLARFRAADHDRKGHLTRKDAQVAGFFPGQFDLLDQNGDGKLTEQELLSYLDQVQPRQARAVTSGIAVHVSTQGSGLFDLLDRNRDGRLSLREIRGASRLLAQVGSAKAELSRADIPRTYTVAIGLCQASFNRIGGYGVFSPRGMPLLALDWSRPDTIWFHKMDRNRDGDVSPREFLGSREDFKRLDTDGDGLISLEEAMQAAKPGKHGVQK